MSIGELVQLIILVFLSGLLLHSSLLYIGFNVLLTASSLYHVGHCLFTCRQWNLIDKIWWNGVSRL